MSQIYTTLSFLGKREYSFFMALKTGERVELFMVKQIEFPDFLSVLN